MAVTVMGPITVTLTTHTASFDAAVRFFRSLEAHLPKLLVEFPDILLEWSGVDGGDLIAARATELVVALEPTQRCLDLVAAISARHFDSLVVEIESCHGWPILSVAGCTPTVAEAGGEAIAPGGGLIA